MVEPRLGGERLEGGDRPSKARPRSLGAVVALVALAVFAVPTGADDEEPPWADGEVARVAGSALTWDDLCRAAVEHIAPSLADANSPAHSIHETIVFDRVIDRLCMEHGVSLAEGEVQRVWQETDKAHRERTGQGLEAALAKSLTPRRAIERDLERRLRAEALGEAGVDLAAAYEAAEVRRGLATAKHPVPAKLPPGVVIEVFGEPVAAEAYGDRLLAFAGARTVAEVVDRACRIRLVERLGAKLDDAGIEAELKHLTRLAPLESRFDPEEVWEQLTVRAGRASGESYTAEQVRTSAFARSVFGLVRRHRETATPADVRNAWELNRDRLYGPHVLVTSVEVPFKTGGDVFAPATGRTRTDAREVAKAMRRRLVEGATTAELREQGLPEGVVVSALRLYPTDRDRLVWERARTMADGETGSLVETLSAWHAVRREGAAPAPTFEEVEPVVRERLARERARRWLEDQLADEEVVRRRWPLPQLR